MSDPVFLNPVESMLVKLASAEKQRVLQQVESDFAAALRPIFVQYGVKGEVKFSENDAGTITMQAVE